MSDNTNEIQDFIKSITETHQFDQAYQAMSTWAGLLWHFYTRLKAQGFTEDQAMTFARDLFRTQIEQGFRRGQP